MAASTENQGMRFALIILFMLFIVLSLATFLFFGEYQRADTRAEADAKKAQEAEGNLRKTLDEITKLKEWIGIPTELEWDKTQQAYTDDMAKYATTLPAEKKYYRQALEELSTSVSSAKAELVNAQAEIQGLKDSNAKFEEASKKQVAEAELAKTRAVEDLAGEKTKFMDAQKKAEEEKKVCLDQLAKVQQEKTTETEKLKKDIEQIQKSLATVEIQSKDKTEKIKVLVGESAAADDGEIRWVNQKARTVWINLGREDYLRRQTTFTVHSPDQTAGKDAKKGTIEVTQILGDHLAEARIIDDSLIDPLVPGDKIYTPLWDPGHPERFAVAGKIDIDGDGRDDHERLRNLILLSGGVVDADLQPDGKQTGTMTVDTRYLIIGPAPLKREPYDAMIKTAEQLGVERIGIDKFLDHIGWRDPKQVMRFGHGSNVETIAPAIPDGGVPTSKGTTSDIFKKRRPGSPEPGSAY
jgi:hypothetical protein